MSAIAFGRLSAIFAMGGLLLAAGAIDAQPGNSRGTQAITGRGMIGSKPRLDQATRGGIPARYRSLRNPLPNTRATMARGALVYAENCASCHGETGRGNGAAGNDLSPPPANLAWFARMPMNRWDPFMYWTIAQGGQAFGTEMPAFEVTLPRNDIWAVTRYVQQQLGGSK